MHDTRYDKVGIYTRIVESIELLDVRSNWVSRIGVHCRRLSLRNVRLETVIRDSVHTFY